MRRIRRLLYKYSIYLQKNCGLTTSQLFCLRALQREPGLSIGQLGRRIYNKPGTITGIIDRLEAKGMVRRQRLGPDRRVVHITITSQGQNLIQKAFRPFRQLMAPQLSKLSLDEKEGITQSLEKLLFLMQEEKRFEKSGFFSGENLRVSSPEDRRSPFGETVA